MKKPNEVTLLIVDDEADLVEVIADSFRQMGWNVLTASGGDEAFEVVRKNKVDIVLSDVRMPKGDGIGMLSNIRSEFPGVPVVFLMTGFSSVPTEELIKMGAHAVFSKPFNRDQVYSEVSKAVGLK